MKVPLIVAALLFAAINAHAGNDAAYIWSDDEGSVRITRGIKNIPERYRGKSKPITVEVVAGGSHQAPSGAVDVAGGATTLGFNPEVSPITVPAVFHKSTARDAWIDTGSEYVVITEKLAHSLGYSGRKAEKRVFHTPSGAVTAPVIILAKMSVGGATAHDVPAAILNFEGRGPVSAIVGMSFLSRFAVEINGKEGLITISLPLER
ncbi:MAG: clan AA aspartic protease [Nitrospinae bacterium]|nr:clan AA aspartic protease [Nitrospinota bacterium]